MADILSFPSLRSSRSGAVTPTIVVSTSERLQRQLRHFDRLCRLASRTGAFRPSGIRTYREDFELGSTSLPGSGRGLTGSELIAHLELVLESISRSTPSGAFLPDRLVSALRRPPEQCLAALNRMAGAMSVTSGGYPLEFDEEEYRLMREYAVPPVQKLGTLVSYAVRLGNEVSRRIGSETRD